MSTLEHMKSDCFASGTLSSASLKGTITKIKSRQPKKRKFTPNTSEDLDTECDICRISGPSGFSGRNRTVRRIFTACALSFLALFGAVAMDFNARTAVWRATETTLGELTSCRTNATLRLVMDLQNMRNACVLQNVCASPWDILTSEMTQMCVQVNTSGLISSCSTELDVYCAQLERIHSQFINTTDTEKDVRTSSFTLSITLLLDYWGNTEYDIRLLKLTPDWVEVLSLRLLVTFYELTHQLLDVQQIDDRLGFQHKWWSTLNSLAMAKLMSESLAGCWAKSMDVEPDSLFLLEASGNLLSGNSSEGALVGVLGALRDTQECLVWTAGASLKLRSRELLSSLSLKLCLLSLACLIYPAVLFSFKQMTEWIQNYACSLRERTEDLKRERRLAEDLLHQMLPKSVAKQLRQQKHVEAESYEQVTIFFSDIVGFTIPYPEQSLHVLCSPLRLQGKQTSVMLNNLYMTPLWRHCSKVNSDSCDVYKVETIGDAYMVVSGLPERNGDKHADEIAKMSLDLVAAVRQVAIPHMPNQRLQLRAGIHTGPCVAGIVGYKMPRYCLFGDTVNTASRMESTSLPQKVHASSATYLALMKDNAYELQLRGEIEVKGKGKMNTYWLVGHKNFSVQNDSLVCHWNPNLARKKRTPVGSSASMANSSLTIQSVSENMTPISQHPSQPGSEATLCVSVQVENCAGSFGTLGSMVGGLQESPRQSGSSPGHRADLLPGAVRPS
ncbi:soluble guanylate cyclase gcy-37 [Alosa alosa]|uniref:soluble guanylate cyclase gcy-37 n=1 Tax=Alosa alosa TaxID=278164 RepID=UPI0020151B8B|nr:soluble guanylate cyclase gcy-37 [Alosa alosa]